MDFTETCTAAIIWQVSDAHIISLAPLLLPAAIVNSLGNQPANSHLLFAFGKRFSISASTSFTGAVLIAINERARSFIEEVLSVSAWCDVFRPFIGFTIRAQSVLDDDGAPLIDKSDAGHRMDR